jgi:hypothetical protein
MKKFFALLLLPSIAFAGKIGENYVSAQVGFADVGFEVLDTEFTWDGFAFELAGNVALVTEESYGLDLHLSLLHAPSLEGPGSSETDVTFLNGLARPYIHLGSSKIFANLAFSKASWELNGESQLDDTEFSPGLGIEFSSDKLTIAPSIDYVNYGEGIPLGNGDTWEDGRALIYTIPVSFQYSEKVDVTFKYEIADFEELSLNGLNNGYIYDSFMFGIDYKF